MAHDGFKAPWKWCKFLLNSETHRVLVHLYSQRLANKTIFKLNCTTCFCFDETNCFCDFIFAQIFSCIMASNTGFCNLKQVLGGTYTGSVSMYNMKFGPASQLCQQREGFQTKWVKEVNLKHWFSDRNLQASLLNTKGCQTVKIQL